MSRKLLKVVAVVVVVQVAGGGCESPPERGSRGGRIDPYRTTEADRESSRVTMPALLEFCDVTAENLVRDLRQIPEITGAGAERQVVLELGDINNKTRTPTNDFEMMQVRLRDKLLASDVINQNVLVVEDLQRMDQQRRRLTRGDTSGTNVYHPEDTYILYGDFYRASGQTRRYYFAFRLAVQTRKIVFREQYDLALN